MQQQSGKEKRFIVAPIVIVDLEVRLIPGSSPVKFGAAHSDPKAGKLDLGVKR
jgi:hypothetical protein